MKKTLFEVRGIVTAEVKGTAALSDLSGAVGTRELEDMEKLERNHSFLEDDHGPRKATYPGLYVMR
jgi:hypothetical protein